MTHPALTQLTPALNRARATASRSRRLQINWVVRDLATALDAGDLPTQARTDINVLLAPATLERFLALAESGAYRTRTPHTRTPSPWSTQARRSALRHITREHTGTPVPLSSALSAPPRENLPTPRQQQSLWAFVNDAQHHASRNPHRRRELIRTAALIGIILDTAGRAGEIVQLTTNNIKNDTTTCTLTHHPQHGDPHHGETVTYRLTTNTTHALRRWLTLRDELTAHHTGAPVTALWVSVRSGGRRGHRTVAMPGLPLADRTVRNSYERLARHLNASLAGDALWQPMPATIEDLRLSSSPTPVEEETVGPG